MWHILWLINKFGIWNLREEEEEEVGSPSSFFMWSSLISISTFFPLEGKKGEVLQAFWGLCCNALCMPALKYTPLSSIQFTRRQVWIAVLPWTCTVVPQGTMWPPPSSSGQDPESPSVIWPLGDVGAWPSRGGSIYVAFLMATQVLIRKNTFCLTTSARPCCLTSLINVT